MASNRSDSAKARPAGVDDLTALDRPIPAGVNAAGFGSDVAADALRATEIPYIALNPGASYRGLHDSLVNYLGNERPQMLLCLHEESAVAIAHGYAKVTGKAMAAAVHSNVGLMHATMAIFNAWCDRMPMVILGATGPVDAVKRRPWIDWIHTARDQGALVRGYTKWDDQPASPAAAREAVLRANWIANTAPRGPTYVNLDAEMQEEQSLRAGAADRYRAFHAGGRRRRAGSLDQAGCRPAAKRKAAGDPRREDVARCQRLEHARRARRAAERTCRHRSQDCGLVPHLHHLHAGAPGGTVLAPEAAEAIRSADVILSLDWLDVAGTFRAVGNVTAKVIQVSVDHHLHNGWSMDYQGLPPVDVFIDCEPDVAVPPLLGALGPGPARAAAARGKEFPKPSGGKLTVDHLATALRETVGDRPVSLTHVSLSWNGATWAFNHPLDYLGSDGGGGVGGGPGISVGAALALKGSGRLPVAVCGDGDFLMGVTALWTAAHYRIPLLIVVANNRSFFNDELHQERVARMRNRPVENRWIGQRISEPDIDLAGMARAQGAQGFGPVTDAAELMPTFEKAIAAVETGAIAVVDVRVEPGYTAATTAAMTRKSD